MNYGDTIERGGTAAVKKVATIAVLVVLCIVGLSMVGNFVEYLDASQVMVIQSLGGTLTWHTSPGYHWQGFGKVTKYDRRRQYWFSEKKDQGKESDDAITMRFNDGAHADLSGSMAWEIPLDDIALTNIYKKFPTNESLEQQLVRTNVEKAVYFTGPLMSSKESYAERRNDLIGFIEDQVANGVYKTITEQRQEPDPITGEKKTVSFVRITSTLNGTACDGGVCRQEVSPLKDFHIKTYNLSINNVKYESFVEAQIKEQQQIAMNVQKSIAEAKQAEQRVITVEKDGQAKAAEAKWQQEVVKAKMVTQGESQLAVAKLNNETAEQDRQALLKKADGEATYRQRLMNADGALALKLDTYLKAQQVWAAAFQGHSGPMVPSVVMGQQGGGNVNAVNGTQQFMDLMGAKFAHDLAIDLTPTRASTR